MTRSPLAPPREWVGASSDPNDVQFGDLVEPVREIDAGEREGEGTEPLDNYRFVLVGEPFDEAVIGRRGAKEGPAAIRDSLESVNAHHFEAGSLEAVDSGPESESGPESASESDPIADSTSTPRTRRPIADLGDVALDLEGEDWNWENPTVAEIQRTVRHVSERCHASDAFPIFLGGDNSLTFANAAPLLESGSLGVINLDAHLDVREVPSGGPTSGTPYRQLFDAGLDAYACVGTRPVETAAVYQEYVRERGGTIVSAEDVGDAPLAAARRALDAMGTVDRVYVSLDLDVLDASAAPGVSAPTPGGLSTRELYRLLRALAGDDRDRIAGFEVVECAPPLDRGGLTSDAAARAIAHFLAGYLEGAIAR